MNKEEIVYKKTISLDDFPRTIHDIVQYFLCPLCKGIPFQALTDLCGHSFCVQCINTYISSNLSKQCPIDDSKPLRPLTQLPIMKILNNQPISCPNRTLDCEWNGLVKDFSQHIDNDCLKQIVTCSNTGCIKTILREELSDHLKDCEYRVVDCPHCLVQFSFIQLDPHYEVCPKKVVPCPQLCGGNKIIRERLEQHIKDECLNTKVCCTYKELGCEAMVIKKNLEVHLEKEINRHLLMIYSLSKRTWDDMIKKGDELNERICLYEYNCSEADKDKDKNSDRNKGVINHNQQYKRKHMHISDKTNKKVNNKSLD